MKSKIALGVIILSLLMGTTTLVGCKKEKTKISQDDPNMVSIQDLKAFMSVLINIPVSEITYDEKTTQFIVFGVNQISRAELTSSYWNSKKRP